MQETTGPRPAFSIAITSEVALDQLGLAVSGRRLDRRPVGVVDDAPLREQFAIRGVDVFRPLPVAHLAPGEGDRPSLDVPDGDDQLVHEERPQPAGGVVPPVNAAGDHLVRREDAIRQVVDHLAPQADVAGA